MSPGQKRYIPLESNPEVFTDLIHNLGIKTLKFQDVYSIEDEGLMALVERPTYALVLVSPVGADYEKYTKENGPPPYTGSGEDEPVIWYRQTIHNACGLYGILHALSNGDARAQIAADSPISALVSKCVSLGPEERAIALEESTVLEDAHKGAAQQGSTAPPALEDEVDYHYVAFVKGKDGYLYEMDGNKNGPINKGIKLSADEDLFGPGGISLVKEFIEREQGGNPNFSLMALVPDLD
ncbi:putative ubiquitin carboxyl-terminal hydrolase [Cylindrobasidium torrendii FP15055 ss-10]|uniref:Ubiquitin carboxyl-terminal hydrolase n=1 Tax=Cylindrobasidium torrendii FP15055 ss-10 TaxID=1314674 RepID=A0A0D7BS35_9AGAR|nr:putative ubiquitin carboxyl-terminal hydrolase [Cylindrobasidium torrendii FP15055 ss-10]